MVAEVVGKVMQKLFNIHTCTFCVGASTFDAVFAVGYILDAPAKSGVGIRLLLNKPRPDTRRERVFLCRASEHIYGGSGGATVRLAGWFIR